MPGSLPCFEEFGGLPTDIVTGDGVLDGQPASEVLDMLIIPGGSLVESKSITDTLAKEIEKMADEGKYLLGICAGFQVLAKSTDTGRLSPTPIIRKGLSLLDVEFEPLICTDRVNATVTGESFLTHKAGSMVTGFHCHTYGKIRLGRDAHPILLSHVKRVNYRDDPQRLISGVANGEGNVVGVLLHGFLDENPTVISAIMKSLDITMEELEEIRKVNAKLRIRLRSEIGVSTGFKVQNALNLEKKAKALLFTALESGAGKTFVLAGLAGALKLRGINVGVLKVGGDIRDIVPALYLIKEPMQRYSSIRLGKSGWMSLCEAVEKAGEDYQLLLIEGAMGDLTGLLNMEAEHPLSTVEVAIALKIPVVIIAACDRSGIEGALVDLLHHIDVLAKLGVQVAGVILNKVRVSYMTEVIKHLIREALSVRGAELLGIMPRLDIEARGMIPEVEIRYEDFCGKALESSERYINIDKLLEIAQPPKFTHISFRELIGKFRRTLLFNSTSELGHDRGSTC